MHWVLSEFLLRRNQHLLGQVLSSCNSEDLSIKKTNEYGPKFYQKISSQQKPWKNEYENFDLNQW